MNDVTWENSNLAGWVGEAMVVLYCTFVTLASMVSSAVEGAVQRPGPSLASTRRAVVSIKVGPWGSLVVDGNRLSLNDVARAIENRMSASRAARGPVRLLGGETTDYLWSLKVRAELQRLGVELCEVIPVAVERRVETERPNIP